MEQFPKSMMEFMNNIPHKKLEHNLYFIQCEDRDGNITEEKFGINLMTDYGFTRKFKNYRTDSSYFIMGTGTGVPAHTDKEMFEEIISDTYIPVSSMNEQYPSYFNKETNMIIGRKLTGTVTLDYNYSWLTSDVNITEFGEYVGGYNNSFAERKLTLLTHAMVYDKDGNLSYFTKRMNEKTTIYIFKTCCINSETINSLYDKGLYLFAYPSAMVNTLSGYSGYDSLRFGKFVSGKCCHYDDYPLYSVPLVNNNEPDQSKFGYANGYYNRGFAYAVTGEIDNNSGNNDGRCYRYNVQTDNGYRSDMYTGEATITSKYSCVTGLFMTSCKHFFNYPQWGDGHYGVFGIDKLFLFEKMNLKEPEELVSETIWTDDFMTPRFRNSFNMYPLHYYGSDEKYFMKQLGLPVNDFNITSVKRYNALTDDYDIEEEFINDPDYDFRNPERAANGCYYDSEFGGYNVMVNINPEVPVIAFREPIGRKIYATNEYWNPETFQLIEDLDNVPKELQNMRYYIKTPVETYTDRTTYATTLMYPVRESNKHALVPSKEIRELKTETPVCFNHGGRADGKFMYGSDNGWIYIDGYVVYPDSQDENGNNYVYDVRYPEETTNISNPEKYWYHYMNRYNDDVIVLIDCAYHQSVNNHIRMRIIKPDPTNPSTMPSYKDYKYQDIFNIERNPPNNSDAYGYTYNVFYTRFEKRYGLLYIISGSWGYYIDITTEEMVSNEIPFKIRGFSPVYDTELFVTRTMDNSSYTFNIYNVRSMDEPVTTFEITASGLESFHGCFGYHDKIYIQMKTSGKWQLFTYNIITGEIKTYLDVCVGPFRTDLGYYNLNAFDCDYDDETIVAKSYDMNGSYDDSFCAAVMLFKNNTDDIIYLSKPTYDSREYSCIIASHGRPYIRKLNGGKDYVCIFSGEFNIKKDLNAYGGMDANMVIDIGKIRNKGYRTQTDIRNNCCSPTLHMPPSMSYTLNGIYSVACLYKDTVAVAFSPGFKNMMLIPIEMFLSHKVTGTTKTIQSYNNPKKINAKQFGVEVKYK